MSFQPFRTVGEQLCSNFGITKPKLGLSQNTYGICICKTDVAPETGRHNGVCRPTTSGGTTILEQCDWKRQIKERKFLQRGEEEEGYI